MEAVQAQLQDVGFKVELRFVEVAEHEVYYSKPFKEGRGPQIVAAMHDNSRAIHRLRCSSNTIPTAPSRAFPTRT